ncbi:MAG: Maf family protein [Synergistes jonesii]|uniref:Maf family protein n=1 Tax=Synergistes jonesii TaxID=2754 RepID=UPI002A7625E6|nr:Maf family protein [Synergistes jonesii]MDY2985066.1 Maf family protein [Synergistes jonesii]
MNEALILASGSPRRRELLSHVCRDFEVVPSNMVEKEAGSAPPAEYVKMLADEKASEVASRFPSRWVVGADTVVASEGKILGKPADEREAAAMLRALSGRAHSVFTGVALIAPDGGKNVCAEETRVFFRPLSDDDIRAYVALGESADKAGAYAIQGSGALLAERIEGCYFNVVGLPLSRLSKMFEEMGVPLAAQWRDE